MNNMDIAMNSASIHNRIEELRASLGQKVCILAHHYQSDDVVSHADFLGDSLELARKIKDIQSEYIIFCGVYFMAETAALLARPGQKVFLPDVEADCDMARMADASHLDHIITGLKSMGTKVVPLTYINSSLAVKSVTGKHGGAVCTSANAERMLAWALEQGDAVLFLPDKFLGENTAEKLGLPQSAIFRLVRDQRLAIPPAQSNLAPCVLENSGPVQLPAASECRGVRVFLWPGFCPVHERFALPQLYELRKLYPDLKLAAHPECPPSLVRRADVSGSTTFIINYAANAPNGSTLAVATEFSLVNRLASQHKGRLTIIPLAKSLCEDMTRTTPKNLLSLLESLSTCAPQSIQIPEDQTRTAKIALDHMLKG